jgi:hypothetical protein
MPTRAKIRAKSSTYYSLPRFSLSAPARALFYLCRTGSSLFEWEYGDDGEGTSDWLHRRFDDPTLPSKKTALGQQGKAARLRIAGGFAV